MDIISDASVLTQEDSHTHEQFLMTYSEEEKQKNEVNSANAKLIFKPEFIPFYPKIKEDFKLNDKETLLYGFIRFYMANSEGRFYFTNDHLSSILDCSPQLINNYIKSLSEKGLIKKSSKIRAGGGTVRFITSVFTSIKTVSEYKPTSIRNISQLAANKNKIKKNNIYNNVNKKITEKENYYAEVLSNILHDEKSITFYKICAAKHDPQKLIKKAREIVGDGQATNPAAVFTSWIKSINS